MTYEVKIDDNGDIRWYLNGKLHREDGPAVEWADGDKEWWLDDKRHRTDGPAVEWADEDKEWWLDGVYLSESEFNAKLNPPKEINVNGIVYVKKDV